jgi:O-antigen/teichoic acid export membrane protein
MQSKNTLTLRQRVLQSGSWTLAGYGVSQALRLGGNLILTRILFPEAFGLMAIYQAVNFGVHMLSDVGVGTSIVQKEHGNDPVFLNTAWTVQIVRGFLAWIALCALALPMAKFYSEPLLAAMLPVVGLTAIIGGFNSTKLYTAQRNLEAARVTQIEMGSSALGLFCTIFLAWLLKSVWALVWGNVITSCLQLVASHIALHGIKNKFAWDRESLKHLRGFGRWILLSSALTFLWVEGARLLIGAMLDMRQLALFTLASTMSLMLWQAMQQVAARVFFPAYSEVHRSNPKSLMMVLYKARLTIILPSWGLAVIFVFFGGQLMDLLYDTRYHGSGAMLVTLAAGSLVGCVWGSYTGVLLAMGKVATSTLLTAIQIAFQMGAIFAGYHYFGAAGIVMGVAAANWILYPVNAYVMSRNGLWQPKLDMIVISASVLIVALAWSRLAAIG